MRRDLLIPILVLGCGLAGACRGEGPRHKAAGNILLRRGDPQGALAEFQRAAVADARDPFARILEGDALFELYRYDEAETSYREAVELWPAAADAYRGLAQIAARRGRPAEAAAVYRDLLRVAPHDTDALMALGNLRLAAGDADGARRSFLEVLGIAGNHQAAAYSLGRAYLKLGDLAAAEETFHRLEALDVRKPYASYGLSAVWARRGRLPEACRSLERSAALGLEERKAVEDDDELAPLRGAPCWQAALARIPAS